MKAKTAEVVVRMAWSLMFFLATLPVSAQEVPAPPAAPKDSGWAVSLYSELNSTALDPTHVYRIREAALDREDLHLNFEDGLVAFTTAVDGHVTGAFFEGHGEVLLLPPDRVERWSLGQFTGSAILEERFVTAYLRFNDDTFSELEPWLRAAEPEEKQEFLAKWDATARSLSTNGSLRLLNTFVDSAQTDAAGKQNFRRASTDRMLYARLVGERVGLFDVYYDTAQPEQIIVAHLASVAGVSYYDIWASFPSRSARNAAASRKGIHTRSATLTTQTGAEAFPPDPIQVPRYKLHVQVKPPRELDVDAVLDVEVTEPGHRMLIFQLSRQLKVRQVEVDGKSAEFLQNQALQGSALERQGNDLVAVVLPQAAQPGQHIRLRFVYGGEVLADAGGGLLYVGARGIWYPTRSLAMSDYDMTFRYPADWTLLATTKRQGDIRSVRVAGESVSTQVAHWVSERPIPFAGFNLGQYVRATARAGSAVIESYAARGMENTFRRRQTVLILPGVRSAEGQRESVVVSDAPAPSSNAQMVADRGARAVEFLSRRLGPFPFSSLALTQMPGTVSQGWPGLIYLSSYVFLSGEELAQIRMDPYGNLMFGQLMEPHEIGHQWWGDLLLWKSYREQWLVEALSNYCALLMIEGEDPGQARAALDHYREQLLARNKNGVETAEAGPVTLGIRLNSSRFPDAYSTISYGRGTWLFHMLREMLLNPGPAKGVANAAPSAKRGSPDEPFFQVLRKVRQRFEGKEITTRDLQQAFEEDLPPQLWYEGRKSLDWFFDSWVNGMSIPRFEVTDLKFSTRTGATVVTGKISQQDATEGLVTSMPVYAASSSSSVLLGRVFVEGPETPFRFTVPAGTKKILLDPYRTVLSRQ